MVEIKSLVAEKFDFEDPVMLILKESPLAFSDYHHSDARNKKFFPQSYRPPLLGISDSNSDAWNQVTSYGEMIVRKLSFVEAIGVFLKCTCIKIPMSGLKTKSFHWNTPLKA